MNVINRSVVIKLGNHALERLTFIANDESDTMNGLAIKLVKYLD